MPQRAKTICRHPGCGRLIQAPGFCDRHQQEIFNRKAVSERFRTSAHARGYTHHWHKARKLFLLAYPLCTSCSQAGRIKAATVVDHIIPHQKDPDLFWNQNNWQPLCARCHSVKTARQDGGFGNPIRPPTLKDPS